METNKPNEPTAAAPAKVDKPDMSWLPEPDPLDGKRSFKRPKRNDGVWPWQRQPGESPAAYRAFCVYRNLGPERSLLKAWRATKGLREGYERATVPGRWISWSSQFSWPSRADAYDEVNRCPEYQLERDRIKRIEYAQLAYTHMTNQLLENLCTELPHLLFAQRTTKSWNGSTTTVQATSPGGLAMLLRELRQYEVALHQGFVAKPKLAREQTGRGADDRCVSSATVEGGL